MNTIAVDGILVVLGSYSGEDAHVDTFLDLVVEMIFMSLILDKARIKS